jgi:hypothetical protein
VITQGKAKMVMEFEHGERSGQRLEGKIRKATQQPPKFGIIKHKKCVHDMKRVIEEDREHDTNIA